ncbi:hypothetical protein MMC26_007645, partial [Xylographa opegraphella]|nr:hypothetical protein [Xylographa opegraphella]
MYAVTQTPPSTPTIEAEWSAFKYIQVVEHVEQENSPSDQLCPWTLSYLPVDRTESENEVALSQSLGSLFEFYKPYGIKEAKERAYAQFLSDAVAMIRVRGIPELVQCYRNFARQNGLEIQLERAILDHDILVSNPKVRKNLAQRLVLLGLNLVEHYDSPSALALFARDQDNLLQLLQQDCQDLSETISEQKMRSGFQIISLVRVMLEISGGKVDCRQHVRDQEYSASDNARVLGALIGIDATTQFGNFNSELIHIALLKSNVFTEDQEFSVSDTVKWSMDIMAILPIGYREGYLSLPSQLLNKCGTGYVDSIRIH